MKITLTINNTLITLENNDKDELIDTLDTIMKSFNRPEPSTQSYIREEFKKYTMPATAAPANPAAPCRQNYSNSRRPFTPCSEKQQRLLRSIAEFKGRDLSTVSKEEAGMAIENWNKSRGVHYGNHY